VEHAANVCSCGDGLCSYEENSQTCPEDCKGIDCTKDGIEVVIALSLLGLTLIPFIFFTYKHKRVSKWIIPSLISYGGFVYYFTNLNSQCTSLVNTLIISTISMTLVFSMVALKIIKATLMDTRKFFMKRLIKIFYGLMGAVIALALTFNLLQVYLSYYYP